MLDPSTILFIHGSGGDKSQTYKACILRGIFPGMITPDFSGDVTQRMAQLEDILGRKKGWNLIGSSLGGLMAALYTTKHPSRVRKLILLAPALVLPEFADHLPDPIDVPTMIIHGTRDEIVPLKSVRDLAQKVFTNFHYLIVEDDHRLHITAEAVDWRALLA